MLWLRAGAVWVLIMALESVNGTARVLWLEPVLGGAEARRLMFPVGLALVVGLIWLTIRWVRPAHRSQALAIGALYAALTLGFEALIGRLAMAKPWPEIWADYDLTRGNLMLLGLLAMALTPWLSARARKVI